MLSDQAINGGCDATVQVPSAPAGQPVTPRPETNRGRHPPRIKNVSMVVSPVYDEHSGPLSGIFGAPRVGRLREMTDGNLSITEFVKAPHVTDWSARWAGSERGEQRARPARNS